MSHENQFGPQQADAFGTLLHRAGDAGAFADIGEHLDRVAIAGQRQFVALLRSQAQALLAGITFLQGALQGRVIRRHMQATALPIDQQRRARRQQQHRRAGTDQRRNPKGPCHDRTVGRGPAAGGENPGDPRRIQACDVRRADFIHHQHIGLIRLGQGFDATELRQHAPADIPQIRRTLGQQGILQRLLLTGRRLDHRHPAGLGAFALLETGFDLVTQFRVVEHFLVGNENFPDRLGLAALDQTLDVLAHQVQGLLQTLTFDQRGLTAQRVIELRQAPGHAPGRWRSPVRRQWPGVGCRHSAPPAAQGLPPAPASRH